MIVYRMQSEGPAARERWAHCVEQLQRTDELAADGWRDLLIDCGEVEAALADAGVPVPGFRRLCVAVAHGLLGNGARVADALQGLGPFTVPTAVRVPLSEGYAFYCLYPENYAEAAEAFWRERQPRRVVCIGIRSIGTSLSAMVTAALERRGCEVTSCTVRPEGHPFERRLAAAPALVADADYAVVDEGPGLSGSTFASVAEALSQAGVPDERIHLFPAWVPDGSQFVSERARRQWARHRKYVSNDGFPLRDSALRDWSGGAWRDCFYTREEQYPAVQPHHERCKFLRGEGDQRTVSKFAGLGRYAEGKLARAGQMWEAGFGPQPLGLSQGFLAVAFTDGSPLATGHGAVGFGSTVSSYLTFIERQFPALRPVPFDELREMMTVNIGEGLGEAFVPSDAWWQQQRPRLEDRGTTAIDGRMLAHEWMRAGAQYIKHDSLDHHDDHFFPGCQDIAWDAAAALIELGRVPLAPSMQEVLPFYEAAYLCYRMGYCQMAAMALGGSTDGVRMRRDEEFYRVQLRRRLERVNGRAA